MKEASISRPCTCAGSNDNCCRCFGSGFIPDGNQLARWVDPSQRTFRGKKKRQKAKQQPPQPNSHQVVCNDCGFRGSVEEVAGHQRDEHRTYAAEQARRQTKPEVENAGALIICPHCRFAIPKPDYYYHLNLCHAGGTVRKGRPPVATPARNNSPAGQGRPLGPGMEQSSYVDSRKEQLKKAFPQGRDRRLDASRSYSQIRENGRFGSHPSHDDFGSDSKP